MWRFCIPCSLSEALYTYHIQPYGWVVLSLRAIHAETMCILYASLVCAVRGFNEFCDIILVMIVLRVSASHSFDPCTHRPPYHLILASRRMYPLARVALNVEDYVFNTSDAQFLQTLIVYHTTSVGLNSDGAYALAAFHTLIPLYLSGEG